MERKMTMATLLVQLLVLAFLILSKSDETFDVRQHLSTVTRYGAVKDVTANDYEASTIPDGCTAIHLNLVARHGTRSPTTNRMRELDNLANRLEVLLRDVKAKAQKINISLQQIPSWLWGWQSPWKGWQKGGELISKGEDELYHLAVRTRERFPDLFDEEYHQDTFVIKATQVPRTSASAVAFGIGLFNGRGSLGAGKLHAFAVTSESRASDILLSFFDCCEKYKKIRKNQEPVVDKLKEPILDEITSALVSRYQLNFTRHDTSSLWFLCKQEASLLDITDQACSLFSHFEIALLEWTDDLELFILKGYGKSINYWIGVPLLQDIVHSMEQAIKSKEENLIPGSYEKARLRFAHAETLVLFSCLLGLFLEGSEFEQIQREKSLELPPKPPQKRNWKGSMVTPFAGNIMLVLHSCLDNSSSKYFVQVLHNEVPVALPGCDNKDFCPFEVFKERIVGPSMKHDFYSLCRAKLEVQLPKDGETQKNKAEL
ncbi:multiple inositol polyphosphate phosphatase 1-like isoform X3 [Macadamia integrifolia]|uniref:multiple inositol polyphosphate phosphatase 1-like isoform X3 n=1 Tax=Macadamia integrifolia TaxID=60698 RepID=UPI001C4F10DD|nr:multiple inositol polyphosphate phosphatase 1-like isoform X3 [Macadamia integrifolia]